MLHPLYSAVCKDTPQSVTASEKAGSRMKLLYVAVLLTLVEAIITTQDMVTMKQSEDMIGGDPMIVKSAVMILIRGWHQKVGKELHQYECAGTIIDQQFILTAANCFHCLDNDDCSHDKFSMSDILVVAGEHDMDKIYDKSIKDVKTSGNASSHEVKRIARHPNYNFPKFKWDLALLELQTPVIIGATTEISRLPPPGMKYEKKEVTVGGWYGAHAHMVIDVEIESGFTCSQKFSSSSVNFDKNLQLCAGEEGRGDSGGGVLFKGWGQPIVVGVATGKETSAYMKTEEALSWIDMESNIR